MFSPHFFATAVACPNVIEACDLLSSVGVEEMDLARLSNVPRRFVFALPMDVVVPTDVVELRATFVRLTDELFGR